MSEPLVVALSKRQLEAYNRADLDAFCACYHADVMVLDHEGTCTTRGMDAFRERYRTMFDAHRDVHGRVDERIVLGEHVVELEHWSRVRKDTGERVSGTVVVRYTEQDGLIRIAEFLRPRG
ncbi:hypothetical protein AKJ09_03510 [Labilithrix luteola]|uniref:SnoaL-like domain-containing protein n=1 Tax=Labilithrix luteola TaxID=1391654 RepID=A0A0K1PU08_9BACT|nr:nuclear transport factor 2 family protein [Labilithrix luteola]AKU96846.1 hypothetical protein AKJ09_03510 [Labilithrix luteola]